jgi:hypothetical protein
LNPRRCRKNCLKSLLERLGHQERHPSLPTELDPNRITSCAYQYSSSPKWSDHGRINLYPIGSPFRANLTSYSARCLRCHGRPIYTFESWPTSRTYFPCGRHGRKINGFLARCSPFSVCASPSCNLALQSFYCGHMYWRWFSSMSPSGFPKVST